MTRLHGLICYLLLSLTALQASAADSPFVVYPSKIPFETVMQDLQMAIEGKGFHINNILHLDRMLERTGKDLGMEKQIFLRAESIEFCSAVLSRRMAEEHPQRIANCPFTIAVYVLPGQPEVTYIAHRRVNLGEDSAVMDEVEAMFESLGKVGMEGLLQGGMEEDF